MANYGRFTIHGNPPGSGGKALDANFKVAEDTMTALEAAASNLSSTAASLSTTTAWLATVADDLLDDVYSLSAATASTSNVVSQLAAELAELDTFAGSISSAQTTLSGRVDSIVARRLPLSAIVMAYTSGGSPRYKAQYGDTHGLIADSDNAAVVLQAALSYIAASGGRLHICSGVYPLSSVVKCENGQLIAVSGSGPATIIRANSATMTKMLEFENCAGVLLCDMLVHGNRNSASVYNRVGLSFKNCPVVRINNSVIHGVPGHGIYNTATTGSSSFSLLNSYIRSNSGCGVLLGDRTDRVQISGCMFEGNCGRADLYASGCADIFISPETAGNYVSRGVVSDNVIVNTGAAWLGSGWNKRQMLLLCGSMILNDVKGSHVTVQLLDYGGAYTGASRDSIRFTLADGKTVLPHECKYWNYWGSGIHAEFVLRLPRQYAGEVMPIYVYWHNANASSAETSIWGDKYAAVWHMYSNTTSVPDFSSYGRTGTKKAANEPAAYATYPITGLQYDGAGQDKDDYVTVSNVSNLTSQAFTAAAVVMPTAQHSSVIMSVTSTDADPVILGCLSDGKFSFDVTLAYLIGGVPTSPVQVGVAGGQYSANNRYHVVGRAYPESNGIRLDLFVNGDLVASQLYTDANYQVVLYWGSPTAVCLGNYAVGSDNAFAGVIDEIVLYKDKMPIERLRAEFTKYNTLYPAYVAINDYAIEAKIADVGTAEHRTAAAVRIKNVTSDATAPSFIVSGNIISGAGGDAITIDNADRLAIGANVISNCLGNGIRATNVNRANITDNVIRGCAYGGFKLPAAVSLHNSNDCAVVGNVMRSNGGPALLIRGNRCVAADNNDDDNCWLGELSATVTSVGSSSITVTVTGLPSGETVADHGYATGESVILARIHNDDVVYHRSLNITQINGNAITLTPAISGLTTNSVVYISLARRYADTIIAGIRCFAHHNIIRVPTVDNSPHCYQVSNSYSGSVTGDYLKLTDNDFIVGNTDESETFTANINIVGNNNTVNNNRGS